MTARYEKHVAKRLLAKAMPCRTSQWVGNLLVQDDMDKSGIHNPRQGQNVRSGVKNTIFTLRRIRLLFACFSS